MITADVREFDQAFDPILESWDRDVADILNLMYDLDAEIELCFEEVAA